VAGAVRPIGVLVHPCRHSRRASGLAMRLCALLDAIPVRGARSLVGNQNGRALGSLRRRFLGLLRFTVRFSLALGHHCLPALASSSVVLVRSGWEAWKLAIAKLDRASPGATAPIPRPRPSPEMSPRRCASNAAAGLTAIATGLPWRRLSRRSRRSARSSNVAFFDHKRNRTVFQRNRHAAWPRLIVMDVQALLPPNTVNRAGLAPVRAFKPSSKYDPLGPCAG
jgi:hypothetical protein